MHQPIVIAPAPWRHPLVNRGPPGCHAWTPGTGPDAPESLVLYDPADVDEAWLTAGEPCDLREWA